MSNLDVVIASLAELTVEELTQVEDAVVAARQSKAIAEINALEEQTNAIRKAVGLKKKTLTPAIKKAGTTRRGPKTGATTG